jgi:hypothetical protein
MRLKKFISAALLIGAAACQQKVEAPTSIPPFKSIATIQDIMQLVVEPSADALWSSVGSVVSKEGTEDREPRTDEDWKEVRRHALSLIEATNLLIMEDRLVAAHGKTLEDSHVEGILNPKEIQRAISADRLKFIAFAHELHDAGAQALGAIDAKNPARLMEAGEKIDQSCEHCHAAYWYPNDNNPIGKKWPAPITDGSNSLNSLTRKESE